MQIDVVVPVYADRAATFACLEAVLAFSGPRLGRLIIVDDVGPDPEMRPALRAFRDRHAPGVVLLENEVNAGFITSCNRGLGVRRQHAVVLNSDTVVTEGWLEAMAAALDDASVAAVCPLSNNAGLVSVPRWCEPSTFEAVEGWRAATARLERFTELPTGVGFCLLLRHEALEELGLFDPAYGRGYNEENDWCQRARQAGYRIVRANHAMVLHHGERSFSQARARLDAFNLQRLVARFPRYLAQNQRFADTVAARAAGRALTVGADVSFEVEAAGPSLTCRAVASLLRRQLPSDGGPGVRVVVGAPTRARLVELISSSEPLLFVPGDVRALEERPLSDDRERRGAAFALSRCATVVTTEAAKDRLLRLWGPGARVRTLALPRLARSSQPSAPWLAPVTRLPSSVLFPLCEAWERRTSAEVLEVWFEGDAPPAWAPALTSGRLRFVRPPTAEETLSRWLGVAGVVLPAAETAWSGEADLARALGIPVSGFGEGPTSGKADDAGSTVDAWRALAIEQLQQAPSDVERRRLADLLSVS